MFKPLHIHDDIELLRGHYPTALLENSTHYIMQEGRVVAVGSAEYIGNFYNQNYGDTCIYKLKNLLIKNHKLKY